METVPPNREMRAVALAGAVGVACWLLAVRSGHPDQVWPVVALPALTWVYMRFPEGFWRGGEQPGTMLTVASLAFGAATLFLFTRYIPIWQGPRDRHFSPCPSGSGGLPRASVW